MQKNFKKTIILLSLFVMMFLCSCATQVGINMLVPAQTNLGGETVIAVSSTTVEPFSLLNADAARYASKITESALSQGVYGVIGVDKTDAVIKSAKFLGINPTNELIKQGASVLVQTSIDHIGYHDEYDENYYKDKNGFVRVRVKVQRVAHISLSCTAWDLKTGRIIDSFVLSDTETSEEKEMSEVAFMHEHAEPRIDTSALYQIILHRFKNKIRDRLVPHYDTFSVKLLKEKNSSQELKSAYDYADDGQYMSALALFENNWNKTQNPVCGYNVAVLYYALGRYNEAIEFANTVFKRTGDPEVSGLILYLQSLLEMQDSAIAQLDGRAPVTQSVPQIKY